MDDLPGNLNIGLIIFVNNAPTNSNNPWLSRSGRNKPANKNIDVNTGSKSNKIIEPVLSDHINSGPILE